MKILTATVALLLLVSPAWAGTRDEVLKHPGYFDFGDIESYSDGEEIVEIDLTQPLLSFVGRVVESEEPELGDLLAELLLVNVRVFSYDRRDRDELQDHMGGIADKLADGSWENIVKVRGSEENVNVFVKLEGDEENLDDMMFSGLAILVLDREEAVFVNVVGNFGLDQISRVGRHFDIPYMDDLDDDDAPKRRSRRNRDNEGE